MNTPENTNDDATANCIFCEGEFPAARLELGYNYCMKPDCREQGFKVKPIEIEQVATEARF